jgi:hypothetical protein
MRHFCVSGNQNVLAKALAPQGSQVRRDDSRE